MNKYFIVSDIHSFYTPLLDSLNAKGFDINNKNHKLIVCGDVFDRGEETIEVYKFLKSIPNNRLILIKGNHEQLYRDLLKKKYPEDHDFSNGTVLTFIQISGYDKNIILDLKYGKDLRFDKDFNLIEIIDKKCLEIWKDIKQQVRESEITKWLKSKKWKNYYELDKYIFVHSFIPLTFKGSEAFSELNCIYYGKTKYFEENTNWRNATNLEWQKASWGCPYIFFEAGLFNQEKEKNKVLICGHYRCSEFNQYYQISDDMNNHNIYYGSNLIAIDGTTALSKMVNVLVIENNKIIL